jgi:hypothetical protein
MKNNPIPLIILTFVATLSLSISCYHLWKQERPKSIKDAHEILKLDAELNYRMAIEAASNSIGTDSAICDTMLLYGFDLKGDPFYQPTDLDKLNALKTTKFR